MSKKKKQRLPRKKKKELKNRGIYKTYAASQVMVELAFLTLKILHYIEFSQSVIDEILPRREYLYHWERLPNGWYKRPPLLLPEKAESFNI